MRAPRISSFEIHRGCRLPAPLDARVADPHDAAVSADDVKANVSLLERIVISRDEDVAREVNHLRCELEAMPSKRRVSAERVLLQRRVDDHNRRERRILLPPEQSDFGNRDGRRGERPQRPNEYLAGHNLARIVVNRIVQLRRRGYGR